MRRREFVGLVGGAAAWPLAARAQQPPIPVIGFLSAAASTQYVPLVQSFHRGLRDLGYAEGRDLLPLSIPVFG